MSEAADSPERRASQSFGGEGMKLTVERPNLEKYRIRMYPNDPDYTKCMWADILIDYDAYTISATSDCGNYAHRWPASDYETFQHLCLRMLQDEGYLLEKFATRDRFDLDRSKECFRACNEPDEDEPDEDASRLVARVMKVTASTGHEWVEELQDLGIDGPWEYIEHDYSYGAKQFVSLLKNIVYPEMKRRIKQLERNGKEGA